MIKNHLVGDGMLVPEYLVIDGHEVDAINYKGIEVLDRSKLPNVVHTTIPFEEVSDIGLQMLYSYV